MHESFIKLAGHNTSRTSVVFSYSRPVVHPLFVDTSAMSGACASEAAERVASVRASAKATAQALPKSRGRHRNVDRPRIDIDDEIESANELSNLMTKIGHAAKMSQRNSVRSKARLVKKCGKLSVQDLERLAVLKRCGLLVTDEPVDAPITSAAATTGAGTGGQPHKRKSSVEMLKKLADVVSKSGGEDVLSCVTDLQEMLKQEEVHRQMAGGLATAKKLELTANSAASSGPVAAQENHETVVGKTTIEEAVDALDEAMVEEEV